MNACGEENYNAQNGTYKNPDIFACAVNDEWFGLWSFFLNCDTCGRVSTDCFT